MTLVSRFAQDETGATAMEYALISMLIAILIISAVTLLGQTLISVFTNAKNALP